MEIPAKIVDESLGFLRGFPRPFRLAALTFLLVPAVVFLHAHYNWPYWPIHDSLWMNWITLAFLIAALFVLAWYSPRPAVSVAELPDTKPVFAESLNYFKEGPELKGPRAERLKRLQNAYEASAVPNVYQLPHEQMQACMTSAWDFDRVAFYLFERYKERPALEVRVKRVRHEMRLLEARGWEGTLTPLHYAMESVYPGMFEKDSVPQFSKQQLEPFQEILGELDGWTARLRGLFTGKRGKRIIDNCRGLLKTQTAVVTQVSQTLRSG